MRDGHARGCLAVRAFARRGAPAVRPRAALTSRCRPEKITIYTRRLRTVRTFSPKDTDITRQWHVIDASDVVLGRLASHVAVLLRGKHKPIFAPHVDTGDFVVVVNAAKVALSGSKHEVQTVAEPTGVNTTSVEDDAEVAEFTGDEFGADVPSEYTTETAQDAPGRAVTRRPVVTGHAAGTGRRKEAIARVRILPGTGQWLINGRTLDVYFPNKVHQQLVSEPFVTLGA